MNQLRTIPVLILVMIIAAAGFQSCEKLHIKETTTDAANLVGYMEKYPGTYSEFLKVLERSGTSSYLNAYGAYTLFAPTNEAIAAYLKSIGKASVGDVSETDLKNMVRFHLLADTIRTSAFTDGKLPVPTMYGEYLITGVSNVNGVSKYIINRSAIVVTPDVRVANGILHTVDHVLIPSAKSLSKQLEENPEYSIFFQAMKATTWADTLDKLTYINDTTPRWLTVLAQKDAVFRSRGINSYADLKARYSNTGDPARPADSLHLYMGYHILNGLKFMADLVSAPSHETLAPQEVVLVVLKGDTVRVNDEPEERGVDIKRATSDITATNGVLHELGGEIYIKLRKPIPVYWDLADQPEIRKLTSKFRKPGNSQAFKVGELSEIVWNANSETSVTYNCFNSDGKNFYYWNDNLTLGNLRTAAKQINWIEFTSPVIVKGKYKVWICWRGNGGGTNTSVTVDGVALPRLVTFTDYRYGGTLSDAEINAQGWKRYAAGEPVNNTNMASKLLGTIEITTTGRHKVRLTPGGDNRNATNLDMIHFIPEDMDQYTPKFATDGTLVY